MKTSLRQPTENQALFGGALLLLLLILLFLARALFPAGGSVIMGIDIRGQFVPWYNFVRMSIAEGNFPLWNPYQLSGYPFFANPQVALYYPPTWLAILLPPGIGISLFIAFHMWLSGLGMLFFVRYVGGNWLGAILATLTWTLSHHIALRIFAGHIGILSTIAWLPWLLLATAWCVRRRDVFSAAMAGLAFGMAILSGNITALFYVALGWFIFAVYLCITTKQWGFIIRQMAIAIVIGLGISMVQLLPALEFALISSRAANTDISFSSSYSLPPYQLASLVNPEYYGSPFSILGYWGTEFYWEATYYIGVLPLLGLLLILRKPTRLAWFYISLILVAVLVAIGPGSFLYRAFIQFLPPFRLLRAPSRAMILAIFATCGLLAESVTHFDRMPYKRRDMTMRRLTPWFLALVVAAIVGSALVTATRFMAQNERTISAWIRSQAFGWPFTLVLLLVGSIALIAYFRTDPANAKRRNNLAFALVVIALLDAYIFGAKYIFQTSIGPDSLWVDAKRLIGHTDGRILPWNIEEVQLQNDASRVGLSSISGYNPMQLSRYLDFIAEAEQPDSVIYDLLGVEFVISKSELSGKTNFYKELELLDSTGSVWIYRRPNALPAARLVTDVEIAGDRSGVIDRILSEPFNPLTTVVLEEAPPCRIQETAEPVGGSAQIIDRNANRWLVETSAPTASILVLSETNYPGWQVRVDGESASPLTAYTNLRAVCLPPGNHIVEWVFRPSSLLIGSVVTLTTLVLVAVLSARAFTRRDDNVTR